MKAKIVAPCQNGKNYGGEKEVVSAFVVLGKINGEQREVVTCRCYMGRSRNASTVYASLWVHGKVHTAGHGSAGGWGYHKESAAVADAIRSAGIELWGSAYACPMNDEDQAKWKALEKTQRAHIGGAGDSSVHAALLAIAKAAGAKGKLTLVSM